MKWKLFILAGGIATFLGVTLFVQNFLPINASSVPVVDASTEGETITHDGVILHWWKYDRSTALTTIVLHGGPEGNTKWMRNEYGDQLADTFGTTVFYDRRGCGASQRENVSSESMTFSQAGDDLMTVLGATTSNDAPVALFKGSMWSLLCDLRAC